VDPDDDPMRLARLLGELANTQWSLGQADRSRETLARALELTPDEPTEEEAQLRSYLVRFKLLQGRFGEIEETAERALEMADALGLENVKANILHRLGPALFVLGQPDRAEQIMREAIELSRRSGTNDDLATAYVNWADALHVMGRSAESIEILEEALPQFTAGNRSRLWVGLLRAEIAFDLGDWQGAERYRPHARGLAPGLTRANYDIRVAELALGRGDADTARPPLEDAADILKDSVEPQFIAATAALQAEVHLRERDVAAARDVIASALDRIQYCTEDAERIGRIAAAGVSVEATAAEAARDLGDAEAEADAVERANLLLALTEAGAEEFKGPVLDAMYAQARAAAARAAADAQAPERWREAAEAWAALGRAYPQAGALWRRAEALIGADDRETATEVAREAHEITLRLGATWLAGEIESLAARARLVLDESVGPPDARGEADDPFGLTDRERQVLVLVASGATNREIAAELFMAEKTASVHVSRILGKLGVRSRTEAAAVAHRQGLAEPVET
jgi:DNA-binding NarL/FixJ family response regulator